MTITWQCRFWTSRGFGTAPLRKAWLLLAVPLLALMVCFPPMRRTGEWIDESTGLPIPSADQSVFDRYWYGYIPSYRWLGAWGTEVEELGKNTVKIGGRGPYVAARAYWVIDEWCLGGQLAALVLLLLPFLRGRAVHENPKTIATP